jgi:hypothetical protein
MKRTVSVVLAAMLVSSTVTLRAEDAALAASQPGFGQNVITQAISTGVPHLVRPVRTIQPAASAVAKSRSGAIKGAVIGAAAGAVLAANNGLSIPLSGVDSAVISRGRSPDRAEDSV